MRRGESALEGEVEDKTRKRSQKRQLLHSRLADRHTERHTDRGEEKLGPLLPSLQRGQTQGIYMWFNDKVQHKYFTQKKWVVGKGKGKTNESSPASNRLRGIVCEDGATSEQRWSENEWLSLHDSRRRGERGTVELGSDGEGDEGRASKGDKGG